MPYPSRADRRLNAVARLDRAGTEERRLEARLAARRRLGAKPIGVQLVAFEIERIAVRLVGIDPEMTRPFAQRLERKARAAPDALGARAADADGELAKRHVDLVLQQGRRGGRGPQEGPSAIDDHHVEAGLAQLVGDQSAADASAHDQHIGGEVVVQRLLRQRLEGARKPEGVAGSQVLRTRGRH